MRYQNQDLLFPPLLGALSQTHFSFAPWNTLPLSRLAFVPRCSEVFYISDIKAPEKIWSVGYAFKIFETEPIPSESSWRSPWNKQQNSHYSKEFCRKQESCEKFYKMWSISIKPFLFVQNVNKWLASQWKKSSLGLFFLNRQTRSIGTVVLQVQTEGKVTNAYCPRNTDVLYIPTGRTKDHCKDDVWNS